MSPYARGSLRGVRVDQWTWDESLYAGSAAYYPIGRWPYPPAVADTVARELGLDGTGRLLDVGCGPGSLTLLLAPLFATAVGVDADGAMVAEAARRAALAGARDVEWRRSRAEELPADLGKFRLVTFAQSFHWMDRPLVAARIRSHIDAGGALLCVHGRTHQGADGDDPLTHPRPPWHAVGELVTDYLGPVRRAGRSTLPTGLPTDEWTVLRAAGYTGPTHLEVGGGEPVDRTVDEVVAAVFSLSSSTPRLFADRLPHFEADLRRLLLAAAADGRFSERTGEIALDIWRP